MKKGIILLFFTITFNLFSQNPFVDNEHAIFSSPLSDRIVGYKINVKLDTISHKIIGSEKIFWLNNTQFPTKTLYFHLFMNAFANNHTKMMRNTEKLRHGMLGIKLTPQTAGYCRVKKIMVNFNDLTEYFVVDETVGILHLPFEVKPGESVIIDVDFETKLPRIMIRSGYAGSFHFVGQWFPKLGVFEQNGNWYCEQYDGNGEFYSDFGVYQVEVTLPSYFTATGTGIVLGEKIEGDVKKIKFYAEDVHDFAFVAWDKFRILSKKIGEKTLYVYYFDEHKDIAKRELDALVKVFQWYQKNIGEYPYPDYKVIDVPFNAIASSGMEYQNFSTSFSLSVFPEWLRATESTVVHEFGHAYWQGMVATNENRQAWADEGLNSFFEGLIMDTLYGKCSELKFKAFCQNGFSRFLSADFEMLKYEKPDKKASEFVSRGGYGLASYNKFALTLKTIANIEGNEVVVDAAREFFQRFKFTHPDGKEFLNILNEKTNNKYKELLDNVIYTSSFPDASVISVKKNSVDPFKGYDEKFSFKGQQNNKKKKSYYYKILVGKRELPVKVNGVVVFDSGRVKKFTIPAEKNILQINIPINSDEKLLYVWVDNERKILIDLDRSNNLYKYKPKRFEAQVALFLFNFYLELISYVF
ncbi:peptidase M1 [Thermotomaculum hydrothermale]|uniref:Peptidase M1 n=1 Tax=Thermotomaculum hydrothermale TaxID=981385 RepID=A0A7R6PPD7_9BACT|nr:M1 family metallopeptidase [Thermotomaculum hydrothermale]BBB32841.1 peptidase M1 [Thermotomaculum hydrothermale]